MTFARITVIATLPDGRNVTQYHSFPRGASLATYRELDRRAVVAFGSDGTRTIGEYMA